MLGRRNQIRDGTRKRGWTFCSLRQTLLIKTCDVSHVVKIGRTLHNTQDAGPASKAPPTKLELCVHLKRMLLSQEYVNSRRVPILFEVPHVSLVALSFVRTGVRSICSYYLMLENVFFSIDSQYQLLSMRY